MNECQGCGEDVDEELMTCENCEDEFCANCFVESEALCTSCAGTEEAEGRDETDEDEDDGTEPF